MSQKKKISIERRPTSASVVDQRIDLLPPEPLKYGPAIQDTSDHQVSETALTANRLHMSFYTQYRTSIFFLKMRFMLNNTQVTVSLTSFDSGQLQPSLKLNEYPDIQLSAIQRDIDNLLRNQGNSHVGSYYCEQKDSLFIPIFEVAFPTESSLKTFLENRKRIEEGLVAKLTDRIFKLNKSIALVSNLTVQLELYLAVTAPKSARRVILVDGYNCHSCMQTYLSSCSFGISELFQTDISSPITELDELMSALHSVVDWFRLGLNFNVPVAELEKIRVSHNSDVNSCKRDMLIMRLKQNELTWPGVMTVLCEMDENKLAQEIATSYGIVLPVDTAVNLEEVQTPVEVIIRKEEVLVRDEEKEKELKKCIQELKEQKEQKQELEREAKHQQDQLEQLNDLIAKLDRDKKKLMKLQHKQLNLSTSLQKSNHQLQKDIRKKDKELEEARDKCTKLQEDLKETKERLNTKTTEVERLQLTVNYLQKYVNKEITKSNSELIHGDIQPDEDNNEDSRSSAESDSPRVNTDTDAASEEAAAKASIKFVKPPSSYTTIGTEEHACFIVEIQGMDLEKLNLSAQLKTLKGSSPITAQVDRKEDSQYEVVYTSSVGGNHTLDIYIDGKLVNTQPVTVYPNPHKPLRKFKSISFSEAPLDTAVDSQGRLWIAQSECVSMVDSVNEAKLHPVLRQAGIVSISISEDDSLFVIGEHNLIKTDSRGHVIKNIEMKESKRKDYYDVVSTPYRDRVRVHRDRVYVYFQDRSQIWVYGCDLERRIGTINLGGSDSDVEFDRNEDLIYVLKEKVIQVLSMKGEVKTEIFSHDLLNSSKFCVAGNYFYVIKDSDIIVLKTSGEYVKRVKQRDGAQPYNMNVGRDGHIYVCCHQTAYVEGSWEGKVVVY